MTCDRIQAALSRAIDEGREWSTLADHLAACPECEAFAEASVEGAARYRARVRTGIDRLRRAMPTKAARRVPALPLISAAAVLLVLLCFPLRPGPAAPSASVPPADVASRISLYDGPAPDPVDFQALAWTGEPPLPRRLDQDLPGSLVVELEPGRALPSTLRF